MPRRFGEGESLQRVLLSPSLAMEIGQRIADVLKGASRNLRCDSLKSGQIISDRVAKLGGPGGGRAKEVEFPNVAHEHEFYIRPARQMDDGCVAIDTFL